jgi:hypothetical protein
MFANYFSIKVYEIYYQMQPNRTLGGREFRTFVLVTNFAYFSNYLAPFQDLRIGGAFVVPVTHVRASAMLPRRTEQN